MSSHALHFIANERYIALRHEADQSRLARPSPAVPSSPPAVPSSPPAAVRWLVAMASRLLAAGRWTVFRNRQPAA